MSNTPNVPPPPIALSQLETGDRLSYNADEFTRLHFDVAGIDDERGLPAVEISASPINDGSLLVAKLNDEEFRGILLGSCDEYGGEISEGIVKIMTKSRPFIAIEMVFEDDFEGFEGDDDRIRRIPGGKILDNSIFPAPYDMPEITKKEEAA